MPCICGQGSGLRNLAYMDKGVVLAILLTWTKKWFLQFWGSFEPKDENCPKMVLNKGVQVPFLIFIKLISSLLSPCPYALHSSSTISHFPRFFIYLWLSLFNLFPPNSLFLLLLSPKHSPSFFSISPFNLVKWRSLKPWNKWWSVATIATHPTTDLHTSTTPT
jgi:hypothetical protein